MKPDGPVESGRAGGALAPPVFGQTINPISTKGADYGHPSTTSHLGLSDPATALPVVKQNLSTAFDDLMRDGSVFFSGSEKEFLKLVQNFKSLQRNFRGSEEERKRLEQERVALKGIFEQALKILNQENAEKRYVEAGKENFQM